MRDDKTALSIDEYIKQGYVLKTNKKAGVFFEKADPPSIEEDTVKPSRSQARIVPIRRTLAPALTAGHALDTLWRSVMSAAYERIRALVLHSVLLAYALTRAVICTLFCLIFHIIKCSRIAVWFHDHI